MYVSGSNMIVIINTKILETPGFNCCFFILVIIKAVGGVSEVGHSH